MVISCDKIFLLVSKYLSLWAWPSLKLAIIGGICVSQTHLVHFLLSFAERDVSPGPGAYNTDKPPLKEKIAPHYSMSPRTSPRRVDFTPSPNMYALPSTIGPKVPDRKGGTQASILGRTNYLDFSADLAKTPGPAKYGALPPSQTKKRAPAYSLGGRAKTPRDINNVPGPGQYSPETVHAHLEASPRYHIGVRHSQYIMPTLPLAKVD